MGVCPEVPVSIYSSSSRQFSVSELVRLAFIDARLIGIHTTPDTAQAKYGRDKLDIILDLRCLPQLQETDEPVDRGRAALCLAGGGI